MRDDRIWKVGDRVRFYKWPATVVYARPPMRYLPHWEYHVCMDGPEWGRVTKLMRTATCVRGDELEELEEK